ncbi:MAG TPA: nicotinate-nucleotide--dimethylbenzimidazole phosphoribosyltransferase [Lactobacillus sp.]|nr:nicotinate-nucleotide--dimethylbenzimidazole phosphoribosyltransferase [Lactobacillus sp.]
MFNVRPTLSPISEAKRHAMKVKLDGLAKPTGGLGRLETLMITLAGIQQTTKPRTAKRCVMVFAGDHGVERAGVSATPRKVTWEQSINTLEGHTTVASLAIANHCEVKVIDVGVDHDLSGTGVIDKKVNWGTKNLAEEPAMTRDEAIQCLQAGYDVALDTINEGNDLLLIGELGVGNTTPASAIISVLLGVPAADVVGRGSVISTERMAHKTKVVEKAIADWQPDPNDPVDVLSKVGGFEIGAKAGAILCAAEHGVPLILDGFLSYAGAVIAEKLDPGVKDHLIASHLSREFGSKCALDWLGLTPMLDLQMAVGEGSGAVLALSLIDAMQSVLTHMNTLADIDVRFKP